MANKYESDRLSKEINLENDSTDKKREIKEKQNKNRKRK